MSLATAQQNSAPLAGRWSLRALFRAMLESWLAHHQRLAELGIRGGL